jgi:hypothetical protein
MNFDSIRTERVWANTNSNITTVHAFLTNKSAGALCNRGNRPNDSVRSGDTNLMTMVERDRTTVPTNYCGRCLTRLVNLVDRQAASMMPSTGEGDYLPPAQETLAQTEETSVTVTEEKENSMTNPNITPEVIKALQVLRNRSAVGPVPQDLMSAINTLDNAGIFSAIDEATGYDIDPAPERVSKCTCPASRVAFPTKLGNDMHAANCPGDPAVWGDLAFTTAEALENERLTAQHNARLAMLRRGTHQSGGTDRG